LLLYKSNHYENDNKTQRFVTAGGFICSNKHRLRAKTHGAATSSGRSTTAAGKVK
jgi:hypothetical protein